MKSIPSIKKEILQTLLIKGQEPIYFAKHLFMYNYIGLIIVVAINTQ